MDCFIDPHMFREKLIFASTKFVAGKQSHLCFRWDRGRDAENIKKVLEFQDIEYYALKYNKILDLYSRSLNSSKME